jgi:hypothetical protein
VAYFFALIFIIFVLLLTYIVIVYNTDSPASLHLITAFSTAAIAILTFLYVVTTNRQLGIMEKQLDEMRRTSELVDRPVIVASPDRILFEKPRAFYSPIDVEYSGHSRYHVDVNVKNLSGVPAVSIHICSCLKSCDK